MQQKKLTPGRLLDGRGRLIQPGYATSLLREYDRSHIRAGRLRIKEWDYYLLYNGRYGLALTLADNSYLGLAGVSLLDFETKAQTTVNRMFPFPMGKTAFPSTSARGDVQYAGSGCQIAFSNDGETRRLTVTMEQFRDGKPLHAELTLTDPPRDSMVIATPFAEKDTAFYYNQKIIGMTAAGTVTLGDTVIEFDGQDTQGLLDWGRGVWTYDNTWNWSAAQGTADGHRFGFNLGYGFGDTSAATENMLFVDGVAHKLHDVDFGVPLDGRGGHLFLQPWSFTSSDQRFEATFQPILDRACCTSAGMLLSDEHQVFGRFTGKAVLDDGTVIRFRDLLGFAERVHHKW